MSNTQAITADGGMNVDAAIGRRVHQLIWDRKTTQTALGHLIEMDPSSIAKRLRGNLGWNATQLIATAHALSTTVAFLVGETSETNEPPTGFEPVPSHYNVVPLFRELVAA